MPAMMDEISWQAWCDGCARPNPGRIGLGAVLRGPGDAELRLSQPSPHAGCNNEAEARALLATLRLAREHGIDALRVFSDSNVVVRLARQADSTEAARLAPLFGEIRAAISGFARLELVWLPQHRNGIADGLARAALGLPPRKPAKPARRRR